MVKHIVAWNYADGFTAEENIANARKVKQELEALKAVIGGIVELTVCIDPLPTGNRDIVLYSVFDSAESLEAYQIHPAHKKASAFVGTVVQNRACVDFIV